MKNQTVTHRSNSSDDDIVLNAGRVGAGSAEVDRTLSLLNEALGGQLFQEAKSKHPGQQSEDEIITVQGPNQEKTNALDIQVTQADMQTHQVVIGEVRPFKTIDNPRTKRGGKNWISRLTAKLAKSAS